MLAALAALAAAPGAALASACDYDVDVSAALILEVGVQCDAAVHALAPLAASSAPFFAGLRGVRTADRFRGGYRLDLAAMAREQQSIHGAMAIGESVMAVGAAWLARPARESGEAGELRVRVRTAPGVDFATAQPVVDGVFRVPGAELAHAGFSAFGRLRTHRLTAPGANGTEAGYTAVFLDGPVHVGEQAVVGWIRDMADAIARFWHGFPADDMALFVVPRAGKSGVPFGRAMAGGGVSIALYVGEHATREQLREDWVLLHELVHVGSPFVFAAPWLTEGLATYLEPLIRARSGLQTAQAMWTEFMTYMPRGAAVIADTGLARGGFRGWYWGGALLMLLADVQMRQASAGRTGLEDCLRHVLRDVGNYLQILSMRDMVSACDAAVGGRVLHDLVQRHALQANPVDLDGLWRELGLRLDNGAATLLDDAPLAPVREAIVRGGRG